METRNTTKYLKYAIGEIILVVIGILIALSINNWNQNQNRLKKETVLLEQLKGELISIYNDVYTDLFQLMESEKSHLKVTDYMNQDLDYEEELCFDFGWLKLDEYLYPETAVYNKIKDEGLDIIRNDSIRINLQYLYENVFPRISRGSSFHPDISEYLDNFYTENFKLNKNYDLEYIITLEKDSISDVIFPEDIRKFPLEFTLDDKTRKYTFGYVPLDYEALKKDTKFQMLLFQADDYRVYKIDYYKEAKSGIKKVVNLIDKILEKE